jgi:chromosome segregation ATPase
MIDFKFAGYNVKGWMVAVGLPVLSSVAGGVWWSYDTLQRFYGVEAGIQEVVEKSASFDAKAGALGSRVQTLEQAINDNDVRGLNEKLATLSTNMQQILEQQKLLLDLRSQVDKSTTVTDNLDDTLKTLQTEIDDIWEAYDYLNENPLGK